MERCRPRAGAAMRSASRTAARTPKGRPAAARESAAANGTTRDPMTSLGEAVTLCDV